MIYLDAHGLSIKSGVKAWSPRAPRFTGLGIEVNSNQSNHLALLFDTKQHTPCSRTFAHLNRTLNWGNTSRSKERQNGRNKNHTLHGRDKSLWISRMAYPQCTLLLNALINPCNKPANKRQNSPVFANTKIILVPTFQGGIMQMNDNRPPFSVKSTQNSHAHLHQRKY